jgi:hypothetical protein
LCNGCDIKVPCIEYGFIEEKDDDIVFFLFMSEFTY